MESARISTPTFDRAILSKIYGPWLLHETFHANSALCRERETYPCAPTAEMKLTRQLKYYYWRFIRLRGTPQNLALGIALGVFSGMLPVMPFQTALAVFLAILFGGSKITAALGTWVSNPLNWYFLYYFSYRIGAGILGLSEETRGFSSVMGAIERGEEGMVVVGKFLGAGSSIIAAFLLGGLILGLTIAPLSYPVSLKVFQAIARWRETRRTFKALSRKSS
jgi:hypothetical protein